MNEELLNSPIVKSQISRYLQLGYDLDYILTRLDFIHLIVVSKEEIQKLIEKEKLG